MKSSLIAAFAVAVLGSAVAAHPAAAQTPPGTVSTPPEVMAPKDTGDPSAAGKAHVSDSQASDHAEKSNTSNKTQEKSQAGAGTP